MTESEHKQPRSMSKAKKPRGKKAKPARLRLFLGLQFPLFSQLSPLIDRLGQLAADPETKLRLMAPENIHVTVKFLGAIEETRLREVSAMAKSLCAKRGELALSCRDVGFFKQSIWVGIDGNDSLAELAGEFDEAGTLFDLPPENKSFEPHVTVARFDKQAKIKLSGLREEFAGRHWGDFTASAVKLYLSETLPDGARYTILESYPLGEDSG